MIFSVSFSFFFFHVGCKNNRWLRRWPVEGRHIQIQGHSLPLFHQRKCKWECKLPAHPCSRLLLLSYYPAAPSSVLSCWLIPVHFQRSLVNILLKKPKPALRVTLCCCIVRLYCVIIRVLCYHSSFVLTIHSINRGYQSVISKSHADMNMKKVAAAQLLYIEVSMLAAIVVLDCFP